MRSNKKIKKRITLPDPKYGDSRVARLTNRLMLNGKKAVAREIVYKAMEKAEKISEKPAMEVLNSAIENVGPILEVRTKRIGGAHYQVPMEVRADRRETLAMRWIIKAARDRQGKPMADFLAEELISASKNEGAAVKRRETVHKMAEANRAFAHYARF